MPRPDPTDGAAHADLHAADQGGRPHAVVVTVSDRSASGQRPDRSGPVAVEALVAAGFRVDPVVVIPDGVEPVRAALAAAVAADAALVLTLGGTGVSPRDRTPEGTRAVLDLELPGVSEAIRARGLRSTPTAALSRAVAGTAGHSLVVNLPGSPAAVRESLEVLVPLVPHVLEQLRGGDH